MNRGEVRYQIETGIPIPPKMARKGMTAAIRKLKVGQSVVLPTKNAGGFICYLHKQGAGKYTSRTIGNNRTRVWRIPDTQE